MRPEAEQQATGEETAVPKVALLDGVIAMLPGSPEKAVVSTSVTGVVIAGTGQWQEVYRLKGELHSFGLRSWSGLVHPDFYMCGGRSLS